MVSKGSRGCTRTPPGLPVRPLSWQGLCADGLCHEMPTDGAARETRHVMWKTSSPQPLSCRAPVLAWAAICLLMSALAACTAVPPLLAGAARGAHAPAPPAAPARRPTHLLVPANRPRLAGVSG